MQLKVDAAAAGSNWARWPLLLLGRRSVGRYVGFVVEVRSVSICICMYVEQGYARSFVS